tara:strand:- start:946 stop:2619 length:1674 start_codon:yes stop_codon:yes gene_type:complete
MRFYQVKKSIEESLVAEAKAGLEVQHTIHDLQAIQKSIPSIPQEQGAEKIKLVDQLKQISSNLENFLQKIKGGQIPQEQPAKTEAEIKRGNLTLKDISPKALADADKEAEITVNKIKQQITAITNSDIDENTKSEFLKSQNEILDRVTKDFETLTAQRNEFKNERDKAIEFIRDVTGILTVLGNKVQGYTMDKDLSGMSSAEKSAYKKMSVNAEKFTKTLKQALFGKIIDMQEEGGVTGEEIKVFLQACADGKVIDMKKVISMDRGNIKNNVNPEHQKVFDVFVKENIFSYSPGTTSGAIGPGEMALSMMGNPAEKGKKGDLRIGNEEIEIKASAKTGGRFNSKKIAKATTGWAVWAQEINKITQNAPEDAEISVTQKDNTEKKVKVRDYNGNRYNVIKGKAKEGSKYNWNGKGLKALNIEILEPYSNPRQTFEMFSKTFRALIQNYDAISKPAPGNDHHKPYNPDELIKKAIQSDGTIDMRAMNIAYSKIAYTSYHLADGITTVMLLRTDTLDYTIFRNADDLVNKMSGDNATIEANSGFNWNDDQQTPTSGYTAT